MPLHGEYAPGTAEWPRKQVELFEATNGQQANTVNGRPIIVLTSTGARTGKLRKNALMRVEHGGSYVVVASRGGTPEPPAWYYNLKANPHVELQDGSNKGDFCGREIFDEERTIWWIRAVETWPEFESYQASTDRVIQMFLLEPQMR